MKQTFLLIVLALGVCSTSLAQVKKTYKIEDDGFEWYEIESNGKRGAQDVNGNTLIRPEFPLIIYQKTSGGWFEVIDHHQYYGAYTKDGRCIISPSRGYKFTHKLGNEQEGYYYTAEKDGKKGAFDDNGKEIISPSRGYDNIYKSEGYYNVEKDGKHGACDMSGREIIAPQYKFLVYVSSDHVFKYENAAGDWVSTGISLNGSSYTSSSSSTSASSSNNSTTSSNNSGSMLYDSSTQYTVFESVSGRGAYAYGYDTQCYIFHFEGNKGKVMKETIDGHTSYAVHVLYTIPLDYYGDMNEWIKNGEYNLEYESSDANTVTYRANTIRQWAPALGRVVSSDYKFVISKDRSSMNVFFKSDYIFKEWGPNGGTYKLMDNKYFEDFIAENKGKIDRGKRNSRGGIGGEINATYNNSNYNGGGYGGSSGSGGTGGSGNVPQQPERTHRHCNVCAGSGKCNICNGTGWLHRFGMTREGYCPSCPNHSGRCSACNGRGDWYE